MAEQTYKPDIEKTTGGISSGAGQANYLTKSARENVENADLLSKRYAEIGGEHGRSLISPENIQRMRNEAMQAISRGGRNLENFGTYGGMDAPSLMGLQAMFGGRPINIGGVQSNPIFDFAQYANAAEAQTAQNKQAGLAELDKILPGTVETLNQAEKMYSSPDIAQSKYERSYPIEQAGAQAAITGAEAAKANAIGANAERFGITPESVGVSGGGFSSGTKFNVPTSKLDYGLLNMPENQQYKGAVEAVMPRNQQEFTANTLNNPRLITQKGEEFAMLGKQSPKALEIAETGLANAMKANKQDLNSLHYSSTNATQQYLTPEKIGTTSGKDSLVALVSNAVGLDSSHATLGANIRPLLMAMPEEDVRNFAEQLSKGEPINLGTFVNQAKLAQQNALQRQYAGKAAYEVAKNSKTFTSDGGRIDALDNAFAQMEAFAPSDKVLNVNGVNKPFNEVASNKIKALVNRPEFKAMSATEQNVTVAKMLDKIQQEFKNAPEMETNTPPPKQAQTTPPSKTELQGIGRLNNTPPVGYMR